MYIYISTLHCMAIFFPLVCGREGVGDTKYGPWRRDRVALAIMKELAQRAQRSNVRLALLDNVGVDDSRTEVELELRTYKHR